MDIVRHNLHFKSRGGPDNAQADLSRSDHAKRLAVEIKPTRYLIGESAFSAGFPGLAITARQG
jgi:hypothetical protein